MTDRIVTRLETCKCGHDKDTHYDIRHSSDNHSVVMKSVGFTHGSCLGRGCDCEWYSLRDDLK